MLPFIIGGAVGLGYTFYKTEKASQMDAKARKKYAKAMAVQIEAETMLKEKKEECDNALRKVANRKRGIIATSMMKFLQVYERIIKIDFNESDEIKRLNNVTLLPNEIIQIKMIAQNVVRPMTDKEILVTLAKGFILFGIGGAIGNSIEADAKRNLAAANAQLKISNVKKQEAETLCVSLDTVIDRCEKIAEILSKINVLFMRSINHTLDIIEKNGYSRNNYSLDDRKALMTCINIASTLKKIIDEPVIDNKGQLAVETVKVIEIGNKFIKDIESI